MTTINGECLTNTQIAGRELQQKYLGKQDPSSLNAAGNVPAKGLPTLDGGTTALQAGDKSQPVKAYGSPASQYLDITV